MNGLLGQLLIAELQSRGICPKYYDLISRAVYDSLDIIDLQMKNGDSLQFPRGSTFTKTFDPTTQRKANAN